jgi:hypothetical protein
MERAVGEAEARTISTRRPDVSHELEAVIERMMYPSRTRRYATIEEVEADLSPFIAHSS